jgi:hypothetical protein
MTIHLAPRVVAVAALFIAASVLAPAHAAPKAGKASASNQAKPSVAGLPEARDAARALRAMEAKLETGLSYADYTREVAQLNVQVSALDELLEERGGNGLRQQLAGIMKRYKDAGDLWGACVTTSDCPHSFINIRLEQSMAAYRANAVFDEFPAIKKPADSGGALIRTGDAGEYNMAYYPTLLSVMWEDAKERGKAFRSSVR